MLKTLTFCPCVGLSISVCFGPCPQISFGMAHDIATSDDGQNVYVAEVNPHRIWKFVHHIGKG